MCMVEDVTVLGTERLITSCRDLSYRNDAKCIYYLTDANCFRREVGSMPFLDCYIALHSF